MDHTQLPQVALVSLGKVLLMGPASEAPGSQTRTLDTRRQRPARPLHKVIPVSYRICWLASLRTRSTSLPLCSSSLVRVSMVSFREWISWSRSVMRLLREHTSACRSEIRASSSCSCARGTPEGPAVTKRVPSEAERAQLGLSRYLLAAVLHGALQLTLGSRVLFEVDLLEMFDRRSMKVVEFCTE